MIVWLTKTMQNNFKSYFQIQFEFSKCPKSFHKWIHEIPGACILFQKLTENVSNFCCQNILQFACRKTILCSQNIFFRGDSHVLTQWEVNSKNFILTPSTLRGFLSSELWALYFSKTFPCRNWILWWVVGGSVRQNFMWTRKCEIDKLATEAASRASPGNCTSSAPGNAQIGSMWAYPRVNRNNYIPCSVVSDLEEEKRYL